MTAELTDRVLKPADDLERTAVADGTMLLKAPGGVGYMALSPSLYAVFCRFDGQRPLRAILREVLEAGERPSLRDIYDMVATATERQLLADAMNPAPPAKPPREWRWPLGWGARAAGLSTALLMVLGAAVVLLQDPPMQASAGMLFWVRAYLWLIFGASLAHAAAACVLKGFGRSVYAAGIGRTGFVFHFKVDRRDAFMGGRRCEVAVALQMLAVPFLLMTLSAVPLDPGALVAAALILLLLFTWPFAANPTHDILLALLRRRYQTGRPTRRLFRARVFRDVLLAEQLTEERYLVGYVVYTILWLAAVMLVAMALIQPWGDFLYQTIFGDLRWYDTLTAALVLLGLLIALFGPVFYQVGLFLVNVYQVIAARWFMAETKVEPQPPSHRPDREQVLEFLRDTLLFSKLSADHLEALADACKYEEIAPGTELLRQGDQPENVYLVFSGRVEVRREDELGEVHHLAWLHPNSVLGQSAVIGHTSRNASIHSAEACGLLVISRDDFQRLVVNQLGSHEVVDTIGISNFLQRLESFRQWPREHLVTMSEQLEVYFVPIGDTLIEEDQQNDSFYLITAGVVSIRHGGDEITRLTAGSFFGEISLLKHSPATANVVAIEDCQVMRLSRDRFIDLVCEDFEAGCAIEDLVEQRLRHSGPAFA